MQNPRRSRKKTRVTSLDIAHRAGVSQATVSRVLAGSPLVNEDTRRRVEAAVRELNYKVDRHASSLRTQRAGTLALLLFEDPTPDDSHINPFFLSILGSITRACARHGHDLLVSFQQLSDDWHADYEDSMKADGLILLGYGDYLAYESKLERLLAQGTHFVRWGHVREAQPGITIGCDNHAGGQIYFIHCWRTNFQNHISSINFFGTVNYSCSCFAVICIGKVSCISGSGFNHHLMTVVNQYGN